MQTEFDPKRFRQALGSFTTGVTIVTTLDADGSRVGMTANSFNSVSMEPPMVLWSLGRGSSNIDAFLRAKHFAVHILASEQDALASKFAQRGVDRFAGLDVHPGPDGIPLLEGCAARFECRTAFQYEGGDHVIFVGEVLDFEQWDREPLVFKRGRFALAVGKPGESLLEPPSPGAFERDFLIYLLGRAYHQLFARIKPELDKRKLSDPEYFTLSLLGVRNDQSIAELNAMVAYTGEQIDARTVQALTQRGWIKADAKQQLSLTDDGRREVVELLAVAQSISVDAEKSLDRGESRALRHLLASVIEATDPGIPHPWKS